MSSYGFAHAIEQTLRTHREEAVTAHRRRVAELRSELGDPETAFDSFVERTFDQDALQRVVSDYLEEEST
jgi:hypothetical protein